MKKLKLAGTQGLSQGDTAVTGDPGILKFLQVILGSPNQAYYFQSPQKSQGSKKFELT